MEDQIRDINLKLEQIHSVLGFILEKTNLIPEVKTYTKTKLPPPIEKIKFIPQAKSDDDLIQLKNPNESVLDLQ
jgi:hypothetical protein